MTKALLTPDIVRRAMLCVSTDDFRYYITGVNVTACQDGGALLVATNGHILVVIRDPNGLVLEPGTIRVPSSVTKPRRQNTMLVVDGGKVALVKEGDGWMLPTGEVTARGNVVVKRAPSDVIIADCIGELASLGRRIVALEWRDVDIDGTFPDWRKVVPKLPRDPDPGPHITVDPAMLARVNEALRPKNVTFGLRLIGGSDPAHPILALPTSSGGPDGFGCIMGMHTWNVRFGLPAWFSNGEDKK